MNAENQFNLNASYKLHSNPYLITIFAEEFGLIEVFAVLC